MMKGFTITLMVLVVALVHPTPAAAQIEITSDDYLSLFDVPMTDTFSEASDTTGATALVLAAGPGQRWDFTGFPFPDSLIFVSTRTFVTLPAGTPGESEPAFADASFALLTEIVNMSETRTDTIRSWTYQGLVQDSLMTYGVTTAIDEDDDGIAESTATIIQSPPSLNEVFPIVYELQWADSTSDVIVQDPISFALTATVTETEVDGWGTLITPRGSAPALRVRRTIRITDLLFMTETTELDLVFVTGLDASFYATIHLDEDGEIETVAHGFEEEASGTATEPTAVVESYRLGDNYPNPFNPTTAIDYSLAQASPVRLVIYNLLGQEVAVLYEGYQARGDHQVTWDASGMPSGLYLYTLKAGAYQATRTMVLSK